jgi:hypothetical protein
MTRCQVYVEGPEDALRINTRVFEEISVLDSNKRFSEKWGNFIHGMEKSPFFHKELANLLAISGMDATRNRRPVVLELLYLR